MPPLCSTCGVWALLRPGCTDSICRSLVCRPGELFHAQCAWTQRSSAGASCQLCRLPFSGPKFVYCRGKEIATKVARGLAYLHQSSVIHLDLKCVTTTGLAVAGSLHCTAKTLACVTHLHCLPAEPAGSAEQPVLHRSYNILLGDDGRVKIAAAGAESSQEHVHVSGSAVNRVLQAGPLGSRHSS